MSVALADRAGRDPEDAEVHLATFVIAGLVAVRVQSAYRHAQLATSFAELNDLIHRDFLDAGADRRAVPYRLRRVGHPEARLITTYRRVEASEARLSGADDLAPDGCPPSPEEGSIESPLTSAGPGLFYK